jgi:hypothetical protein
MSEKRSERTPPHYLYAPTYFHIGFSHEDWFVEEQGYMPIQIGQHILGGAGEFYEVVDVWFSFDHHGLFGDGQHVFMEPAELPRDKMSSRGQQYFSDVGD